MTHRHRILMLPSWYPTDRDPIAGSFFREQATALERDFDFLVAIVSFERLSFKGALRVLLGRGSLRPRAEEHDYQAPPRVFKYVGYGISTRRLRVVLPYAGIINAVERLNDRLERRLYRKACEFAAESFDFRPDLIYAMTAQINAIQATDLGKAMGIPVVVAEHVPFSIDAIPERNRDRLRRAIEGASAVLTVSHDKSRQLLMGNIDCHPIVVGNMVDENMFAPRGEAIHDYFTVLIVAAYNFYKDYPTFLRAMTSLRRKTSVPFRVVIIGIEVIKEIGLWSKGLKEFNRLLAEYDLSEITNIIGFVPRSEMAKYYQEADAFVLTSIQEGLPVSVLEAMASGLPVFSTRCGGVEDVVDDSCGKVVPVRDHEGIAEGLKRLVEGDAIYDREHIREKVVSVYGIDAFTDRISGIFREMIARGADHGEGGRSV